MCILLKCALIKNITIRLLHFTVLHWSPLLFSALICLILISSVVISNASYVLNKLQGEHWIDIKTVILWFSSDKVWLLITCSHLLEGRSRMLVQYICKFHLQSVWLSWFLFLEIILIINWVFLGSANPQLFHSNFLEGTLYLLPTITASQFIQSTKLIGFPWVSNVSEHEPLLSQLLPDIN